MTLAKVLILHVTDLDSIPGIILSQGLYGSSNMVETAGVKE